MTLRDKIMDKYWAEFLAYRKGTYATSGYFWNWFYTEKMSKNHGKLEDYLK